MSNNLIESESMIAAVRRREICKILTREKSVNATELAEKFGVGISTIRRDLDALHDEGKLSRVHGGAVIKETAMPRIPYQQARDSNLSQKIQIAEAALAFLPESGNIFIGGGTTSYQFALRMPANPALCVTTNGLDIAAHIASNRLCPVDFAGGTIRPESLQSNCEEALETLYWDVTFMSVAALDITRGITTDNRNTAHQEQLIYRHGSKFVALCDSSKIGRFAYAHVAPVSIIDVLVTDQGITGEQVQQLEEQGVQVVVAGDGKA